MHDDAPRQIVANQTTKRNANPNESPPWKLHDAAQALRREQTDREREEARPVKLVDLELPFGAVFALFVQFAIIQVGIAAVVLVVLFALGVL